MVVRRENYVLVLREVVVFPCRIYADFVATARILLQLSRAFIVGGRSFRIRSFVRHTPAWRTLHEPVVQSIDDNRRHSYAAGPKRGR